MIDHVLDVDEPVLDVLQIRDNGVARSRNPESEM